jgi:hypothetical protein
MTVSKMSSYEKILNKMSKSNHQRQISVEKMTVSKMPADKETVDKMSKMIVEKNA